MEKLKHAGVPLYILPSRLHRLHYSNHDCIFVICYAHRGMWLIIICFFTYYYVIINCCFIMPKMIVWKFIHLKYNLLKNKCFVFLSCILSKKLFKTSKLFFPSLITRCFCIIIAYVSIQVCCIAKLEMVLTSSYPHN